MKANTPVFLKNTIKLLLPIIAVSCNTTTIDDLSGMPEGSTPNQGIIGNGSDDGETPTFDATISSWNGQTASDAANDVVGTDADIYHEANTFDNTVTIAYNGDNATVTTTNKEVLIYQTGAYVTVDMSTNTVSNVNIVLSGSSDSGGLKIYGSKKFKLTFNGIDLTSQRGPAINCQCKKRMFAHIVSGTTNKLTDCTNYTDDTYYLEATDEDRKGCMFSEGNLIFSGNGTLIVSGKYKHAIATDGYFWMRPGVTIVVSEAAKNGIQVKGDADDGIGVTINGGLIYANISSTAGKAIKTDYNVNINGGELALNTSGAATYDSDEKDTTSAAGIKADGNIYIDGGSLTLKSTGTGGKGLNADGEISISGGETTITTTGGKYTYSSRLTSSPKGAKADGNINISGGKLNISVTGKSDGSEGLESKSTLTFSGGYTYVYAYDDAINAKTAINIKDGCIYVYSANNDGIDSNGSLTISGGLVLATGSSSPECGIDVDNSNNFKINGGTVVAIAGNTLQSKPSSSSAQCCVEYGGLSATKDKFVALLNNSGSPIFSFQLPKTLSNGAIFFSNSELKSGATYSISSGGSITSYTDSWNGWYAGGTWSGGTTVQSFTISSRITSLGSSNNGGMGGGHGGGGGGWR